MHSLRDDVLTTCPVCGAVPLHECEEAEVMTVEQTREYHALRVLFAVRELREIDPKHPFVTIFEAAGGFRGAEKFESAKSPDDLPSFLRRQAE